MWLAPSMGLLDNNIIHTLWAFFFLSKLVTQHGSLIYEERERMREESNTIEYDLNKIKYKKDLSSS